MEAFSWDDITTQLRLCGISFDRGLTDAEIASAESQFGFRFPPDLRAFLQTALPHGTGFPDWRNGSEAALREWLDLPRRGVLFDVENGFWLEEWGPRPEGLNEAKHLAEQLVAAAPCLIPIYIHRMMPAQPHLSGNPVFSVMQTDIIVYGRDLREYLANEFLTADNGGLGWLDPTGARRIAFWDIERFQEVTWGA